MCIQTLEYFLLVRMYFSAASGCYLCVLPLYVNLWSGRSRKARRAQSGPMIIAHTFDPIDKPRIGTKSRFAFFIATKEHVHGTCSKDDELHCRRLCYQIARSNRPWERKLCGSRSKKVEIGGCMRNNGSDMGSVTVRHVRQGCDVMCET